MTSLPKLNYQDFVFGTEEQRQCFAKQIVESFKETGFVKIINHGFSDVQVQEVFQRGREFFNEPLEVKKKIENHTNPSRGYTPFAVENTNKMYDDEAMKAVKDAKESFDQGPQGDLDYPSQWPEGRPEFRIFMTAFYDQCEKVCLDLIKAVEIGLGVRDASMIKRCIPGGADLRLTHYPSIGVEEVEEGRWIRIASHADFGVMTLLFQDGIGGLEIEDRTAADPDSWIPVVPTKRTEMIVDIGETMQRWTNDRLKAGIHRVATPKPMKGSNGASIPSRISMGFLFKAKRNASVGPLPDFVSEAEPAKYAEMTGIEYHQWSNTRFYK